jgi:glutamate dehydrogenase/leucine dehydrogenase
MGGLPHELGSTGFGVYHAAMSAAKFAGLDIEDSSFAVEGFGNVGMFAAKFLTETGCKMVAASDSKGVVYNEDGIDFEKLLEKKNETGRVIDYSQASKECCENILDVEADILITAAIPDLIRVGDIHRLHFKLIVEGSNIPMTQDVEELCHKKGILVVPDFVANAGGLISSYVEYIGDNEDKMFKMIENKIIKNSRLVLEEAEKNQLLPRVSALKIAKDIVRKNSSPINV